MGSVVQEHEQSQRMQDMSGHVPILKAVERRNGSRDKELQESILQA